MIVLMVLWETGRVYLLHNIKKKQRQQMSSAEYCPKSSITPFFIIYQALNFILTTCFLVAFSYRYNALKKLNKGNKYTKFYPRKRVILSILYIVLSLTVVVYNIAIGLFPLDQAYNYILQGGGASVLNSIVIVIQLLVLKQELDKQQRYTRFHYLFFLTLIIFSTIRFVFSFQFNCYLQDPSIRITNIILSGVLSGLSLLQFCFWIYKSQHLPHFRTTDEIDIHCELQNETIGLPSPQSHESSTQSDFPYLVPLVNVEDGQIRVILQLKRRGAHDGGTNIAEKAYSFTNRLPLLESKLDTKRREPFSSALFDRNELKSFIVRCSRFPLRIQLPLYDDLPHFALFLGNFLTVLLRQKDSYQLDILRALKIKEHYICAYQRLEIKQKRLKNDPNAIYCSIQVFNHIWATDHHQYCIRSVSGTEAYSARRFSELDKFHRELKANMKGIEPRLLLPPLPRNFLSFYSGNNGIKNRQKAIENYLRQLTNDSILIQETTIRNRIQEFLGLKKNKIIHPIFQQQFYQDLVILPKEVARVMSGSQCITIYEFSLKKGESEIRTISKRYSEFQELQRNIERWSHNSRLPCECPELPSSVFSTSEAKFHSKLVSYLQNLVMLPGIGKVYAANVFFKAGQSLDSLSSENSDSGHLRRSRVNLFNRQDAVIESKSPSNFSDILNDLGDQQFD